MVSNMLMVLVERRRKTVGQKKNRGEGGMTGFGKGCISVLNYALGGPFT